MRFELTTSTLARWRSTTELRPHFLTNFEMERAMRFELTTSTLARWRSTTELRPRREKRVRAFYMSDDPAQSFFVRFA